MVRPLLIALALIAASAVTANAEIRVQHGFGGGNSPTYVRGYYRSSGTYVQPHYRSYQDGNFYNNWSTYPNVNPYTGSRGYRTYPSYPSYGSGYYVPYGAYGFR